MDKGILHTCLQNEKHNTFWKRKGIDLISLMLLAGTSKELGFSSLYCYNLPSKNDYDSKDRIAFMSSVHPGDT
jgi:hypothetical protein